MKVRVLKPFNDAKEKKVRRTGDVFECSEERFDEITKETKYIEKIPGDENNKEPAADVNTIKERFEAMTVTALREYADKHHKLTFHENVKKSEMVAALVEREKGC